MIKRKTKLNKTNISLLLVFEGTSNEYERLRKTDTTVLSTCEFSQLDEGCKTLSN